MNYGNFEKALEVSGADSITIYPKTKQGFMRIQYNREGSLGAEYTVDNTSGYYDDKLDELLQLTSEQAPDLLQKNIKEGIRERRKQELAGMKQN